MNMRDHANWNKPEIERKVLDDLTFMWNLKKEKSWAHRGNIIVIRCGCYVWGKDIGQTVQRTYICRTDKSRNLIYKMRTIVNKMWF
jgi:hypothetical protein